MTREPFFSSVYRAWLRLRGYFGKCSHSFELTDDEGRIKLIAVDIIKHDTRLGWRAQCRCCRKLVAESRAGSLVTFA